MNGLMIKIAVCDDEKSATLILSQEIEKTFREFGAVVEMTVYNSGISLKKEIFSGIRYDVIFLDIGMPDVNGISVAKRLKEHDRRTLIIFVSSKEEYVFKSFSAMPFRFLRKNTFKDEIRKTARDIIEELCPKESNRILIPFRQSVMKVDPYEIIYVEAENKSTKMVLASQEIHCKITLAEFKNLLTNAGFIQIHRSYLVNYRYIFSIHKEGVALEDKKTTLPISRHRLAEVKNVFQNSVLKDIT